MASSIFAVILVGLWWFKDVRKRTHKTVRKRTHENVIEHSGDAKKPSKLGVDIEDAISMGSLIITLAASGLYPFLINPMLDYMVSPAGEDRLNMQMFKIDLTNWGLSRANNVILSVSSDNTKFFNFTSEPFLGNVTRSNTSVLGNAMFSIPVLPLRSHTLVDFKADVTDTNSSQRLITFVRSDEKVGYHDVVWTISFYLILGIIMILLFIILVFIKKVKRHLTLKKIGLSMIPIGLWMLIFSLIYLSYNVGRY